MVGGAGAKSGFYSRSAPNLYVRDAIIIEKKFFCHDLLRPSIIFYCYMYYAALTTSKRSLFNLPMQLLILMSFFFFLFSATWFYPH